MTSAELLDKFNRLTGRPAADVITDATKYGYLADAEEEVIQDVIRVKPALFYQRGAPGTMVTTDQNIFTFGTGVIPLGDTQIYQSLRHIPDRPWKKDVDYLDEGDQIRLPRGRKFTGTLYWRGVILPARISASEAPHFIPSVANNLTAYKAANRFAIEGGIRNERLATIMAADYDVQLRKYLLMWKRQFSNGGAMRLLSATDLVTPLL